MSLPIEKRKTVVKEVAKESLCYESTRISSDDADKFDYEKMGCCIVFNKISNCSPSNKKQRFKVSCSQKKDKEELLKTTLKTKKLVFNKEDKSVVSSDSDDVSGTEKVLAKSPPPLSLQKEQILTYLEWLWSQIYIHPVLLLRIQVLMGSWKLAILLVFHLSLSQPA